MNVNLSGKLNINITNKQNKFKGIPFDLVFEAYTRNELNSAIDNLATHLNNGCSRISFASKIDNYVKNNNHFIPIKPFINQLTDGTVLTMALKKFVELVFEREKFLKLICYFLDKEMCKFPLTMGEFNSYRRTHQTKIENSALYYKFRTLSIIFEHLDVFVHLLVAGKPSLLAQKDDIKKSIIRKNYREFYNFFAPELSSSIEELFYWCCDYEAKNKKTASNSTPTPQANTSQPTPTPQSNTSQPTPIPQANTSQPTSTSNSIDIKDVFSIYEEYSLKGGIDIILNNRDTSIENIIEKISIFTNPKNPFRTSKSREHDPDSSIFKNFLTELANIICNRLMFTRLISVYLDMEIYRKKSKHNITPEEVINGLEINNELRPSSIEKSIENIKFLEKLFTTPSIFGYILQDYYIYSSKDIIKSINNNDYDDLYRSLLTNPEHPIEKLFYWCHKFDTENNKVIPEPEGIKVQSVFEPEVTNTISEPEATTPTSKPEVADDTDSKEQVIKPQKVNKSKAYMDLEMVNKMIEDLNNMINSNSKDNSSLVFDEELGTNVLKSLGILITKFTELTDVLSDHKSAIYNFIESAEVITKIKVETEV